MHPINLLSAQASAQIAVIESTQTQLNFLLLLLNQIKLVVPEGERIVCI